MGDDRGESYKMKQSQFDIVVKRQETCSEAAIQAFTQPGDKIIIQPPVYPRFFRV
jgi:bifunctional pyridoxal-dependent enzyme with beta-cystathionase and maltose regulon repressor activities